MSQRTYGFFANHSKFFYPSCASPSPSSANALAPTQPRQIPIPSSSSNPDIPSSGPPPILPSPQSPTPLPSHPSSPPTPPLRAPSPAFSPRPLTPTISQVATPTISSYISPSSQPRPHSIEHRVLSSGPAASSQSRNVAPQPPTDLLPSPALVDPAHSPLLPLPSRSPTPQFCGPTFFAGAHSFNISGSQFNDFSLAGSGLKDLLKHSMPDAFHNSAARYPPPKCHLGTREEYITRIIDWALGTSDHGEPVLWMRGPFGVGKSAVAQSCAEALQRQNRLAATLFFSRSNSDRDDPRRVFTSIAYQIATLYEPFSNIVDARVRKDPALGTKSLSTQFEELLVRPLAQVDSVRSGINRCVIIIDGLDECRGSLEQCEIIRIIATSARNRTTPFLWFITSRPEDPIIRTMKSPTVLPISLHLELPVSNETDHEILLYLTDELEKIRESHGLAGSWPPGEVLSLLVGRASGLWIYITTIVRFIANEDSYGPEYQLRLVVEFTKGISTRVEVDNPLAEMDFLYTLIMQQIPDRIRRTVQDILLIHCTTYWSPGYNAAVLGHSEEQVRRSCSFIQSVMELRGSDLKSLRFHFYHASFLDFMKDPARSKELSIHGDFLVDYRRERLEWLHQVCSLNKVLGSSDIIFPAESTLPDAGDHIKHYSDNLVYFWTLCGIRSHPFDFQTAESFGKLPFRMILRLMGDDESRLMDVTGLERIRDNLPTDLRDKTIRMGKCPTPGCTNTRDVMVFGHVENETVVSDLIDFRFRNSQNPPPGRCFCGSRIESEGGP